MRALDLGQLRLQRLALGFAQRSGLVDHARGQHRHGAQRLGAGGQAGDYQKDSCQRLQE
ncbi:hypothetical protein [Melaminivora jejuensis]|uniref:hypothetical protein n=1 Tax=Melaminivora jejuensis TaxID=1267217 RepID=UPI002D7F5E34|nr:hypothetical protein [Melaminivora jejuensis]